MACWQTDPDQMDRLSNLPDELLVTILSFLPTLMAARTSVLCRRFQRLWEVSPSVRIIQLNPSLIDKFIAVADRALLNRNPSHSLHSLWLELFDFHRSLPDSYIPSLLAKARSLGLRHLAIVGSLHFEHTIISSIFSIKTLESLALPNIGLYKMFPSGLTLTCLRSLSVGVPSIDLAKLNQLLSELYSLEDLHLDIHSTDRLSLSSQTIRKLQLIIEAGYPRIKTLELFLPSLESLHLESQGFLSCLFHIHGEVPLLRRALISLHRVSAQYVSVVSKLLSCISHVEELSLHVKEGLVIDFAPFLSLCLVIDSKLAHPGVIYRVPILSEPGKNVPNFPNLKRLDVGLCFHEHDYAAIIMMLHNFPALELLKLVSGVPRFTHSASGRKWKDWREVPRNRHYAYFRGLHLGENRKELMNFLGKKSTCTSHAQN